MSFKRSIKFNSSEKGLGHVGSKGMPPILGNLPIEK